MDRQTLYCMKCLFCLDRMSRLPIVTRLYLIDQGWLTRYWLVSHHRCPLYACLCMSVLRMLVNICVCVCWVIHVIIISNSHTPLHTNMHGHVHAYMREALKLKTPIYFYANYQSNVENNNFIGYSTFSTRHYFSHTHFTGSEFSLE